MRLYAFILLLAFSAAAFATGPYNTSSEGGDTRLMLRGHDPVAYFTLGKSTPGDPSIKTDFDGVTYRFVSEDNRFDFMKNPFKYVPAFGGFCANGIVYGIPWGGEPDTWKIIDGRLHIFGGEWPRRYFLMDEDNNARLARFYWRTEVEGSFAVVQRARRLAIHVPHYKSDKELANAWKTLTGEAQ